MTTSYALMRFILASSSQLPISRGEYDELKAAQEGLLQLRFAEEKFDVVLQNYLEIEARRLGTFHVPNIGGSVDADVGQMKRAQPTRYYEFRAVTQPRIQ